MIRIMQLALFIGLACAAAGLYFLLLSTVIEENGMAAIFLVGALLSLALLLLVPAKVCLILRFMNEHKKIPGRN